LDRYIISLFTFEIYKLYSVDRAPETQKSTISNIKYKQIKCKHTNCEFK